MWLLFFGSFGSRSALPSRLPVSLVPALPRSVRRGFLPAALAPSLVRFFHPRRAAVPSARSSAFPSRCRPVPLSARRGAWLPLLFRLLPVGLASRCRRRPSWRCFCEPPFFSCRSSGAALPGRPLLGPVGGGGCRVLLSLPAGSLRAFGRGGLRLFPGSLPAGRLPFLPPLPVVRLPPGRGLPGVCVFGALAASVAAAVVPRVGAGLPGGGGLPVLPASGPGSRFPRRRSGSRSAVGSGSSGLGLGPAWLVGCRGRGCGVPRSASPRALRRAPPALPPGRFGGRGAFG